MTDRFGEEFEETFDDVRGSVREQRAVVVATVVAAGVSGRDQDDIDVLVFADRDSSTTEGNQRSGDQVTLSMRLTDGAWRVDGISTSG